MKELVYFKSTSTIYQRIDKVLLITSQEIFIINFIHYCLRKY